MPGLPPPILKELLLISRDMQTEPMVPEVMIELLEVFWQVNPRRALAPCTASGNKTGPDAYDLHPRGAWMFSQPRFPVVLGVKQSTGDGGRLR